MILSMIQAGSIPNLGTAGPEFSIDFIPIDYLVSVMAHLSSIDAIGAPGRAAAYYHIGNPSPLKLRELPAIMPRIRDDGVRGSVLPFTEWIASVNATRSASTADDDDDSFQLEKTVFKQFLQLGHVMFSLDGAKTKEALRRTGEVLECPPVDEKYLSRLFQGLKALTGRV